MAQGSAQPVAVQHGLLGAQAARGDPEGRDPAPAQQAALAAGREGLSVRNGPGATRAALAVAAALVLTACGASSTPAPIGSASGSGLILMSLHDGTQLGAAAVGSDPVAVIASSDGHVAFVADSAPGDVYAVTIPALTVMWRQHVGGSPFGLLLHGSRLLVSLFA